MKLGVHFGYSQREKKTETPISLNKVEKKYIQKHDLVVRRASTIKCTSVLSSDVHYAHTEIQ